MMTGYREISSGLTLRCSGLRYAAPLNVDVRAGGISLLPTDRLSGLLSAIPSLLKEKPPAGGKLKKLCYGYG